MSKNEVVALKAEFEAVCQDIRRKLVFDSFHIPVKSWQSMDAPQPMPELLNYSFTLNTRGIMLREELAEALRPNLPWADNHFFHERVSGAPINPGTTWREWPYAKSADTHRRPGEEDPQFDHSYAERYWPKYAGRTEGGRISRGEHSLGEPHQGIRFPYGDVTDLVRLMIEDPLTRQAYLPIWFPEDLAAAAMRKRVPCSLGYHFIRRDGRLHVNYPMRSCDFVRHFRDDVYLTIRLQIWLLSFLRLQGKPEDNWGDVETGTFTMHITSLHCFESDLVSMKHLLQK